jgi:ribosomal protein S18 acetylase RimI-like enzyme
MRTVNSETLKIRELVPDDTGDLLKVLKNTGVFKDYEIDVADEVIQDSLKPASDYFSFCAVNEFNRAVGFVCCGPTPCTSGTFDLYWIAVDPGHQGNGIGKRLLHQAESFVLERGARLMLIETSATSDYDNTRSFYLGNGYNQLAIIPDYYRPGDDKIIYGKTFVS